MTQMMWQNGILKLRKSEADKWQDYFTHPLAQPDLPTPHSKGWATYQFLLKTKNWELVKTPK